MKKHLHILIVFFTFVPSLIAVADANKNNIKNDYSLVARQGEQGQSFSFSMQKIYLYAGRGSQSKPTENYVLVDDRDYAYLNQFKWGLMKLYHCDNPITYARRYETIDGKYTAILMHRVILGLKGRWEHGDHINGNTMDNTRDNLRIATHTENMRNRRQLVKKGTSRYKGVSFHSSKYNTIRYWVAHIKVDEGDKRAKFDNEISAARQYNLWAIQYRGQFANINILP